MKQLQSNKKLMQKYRLSEEELFKIMNKCIHYYLSEEELHKFIMEDTFKKENKLNKRYCI
jgi:hypothetical protein